MEYRIEAYLHIVDYIDADSEDEAKDVFMSEIDYGGELYGVQMSCEESE